MVAERPHPAAPASAARPRSGASGRTRRPRRCCSARRVVRGRPDHHRIPGERYRVAEILQGPRVRREKLLALGPGGSRSDEDVGRARVDAADRVGHRRPHHQGIPGERHRGPERVAGALRPKQRAAAAASTRPWSARTHRPIPRSARPRCRRAAPRPRPYPPRSLPRCRRNRPALRPALRAPAARSKPRPSARTRRPRLRQCRMRCRRRVSRRRRCPRRPIPRMRTRLTPGVRGRRAGLHERTLRVMW